MAQQDEVEEFLDHFMNQEGQLRLRMASVTASPGGGVVTVSIDGGTMDVHYLSTYAPSVGNTVWLLVQGIDAIVLGKLA